MEQADLDKRAKERILPILVGAGILRLTGCAEVVSSSSRAVNARHSQGFLVSFVRETRDMTFLSVCLPALFRQSDNALVPGCRVRFDGERVITKDFIVDFLKQPTWPGKLTRTDVKGFCASTVSLVKETLLVKGRAGGFLGLLCKDGTRNPFVDKAIRVMSGFQSASSRTARFLALSGLAGLGPGSTPSGDDFVTGVLLGDEALRLLSSTGAETVAGSPEPMIPWPKKREDLWIALDRTNDAGKTLLWQALQGRFPKYLIEALQAVSHAKGKQEIADAVEKAVGRGATSGTDALTGFLFSMEGRL